MSRLRRVLHATDFSPASRGAFAKAVEMAQQNNAELVLLHAVAPLTNYVIGDHYADPALYAGLEESSLRAAEMRQATISYGAPRTSHSRSLDSPLTFTGNSFAGTPEFGIQMRPWAGTISSEPRHKSV